MAMLCCVSRKAAGGSDGDRCRASAELSRFVEVCRDLGKVRDQEDEALRKLDEAVMGVAAVANSFSTFRKLETLPEESFFDNYHRDSQQAEAAGGVGALQQCTVCDRKFNSQSYERHVQICERTAARKRKPFDSAKQRIQGTDLAEFQRKKPDTLHEYPTRRASSHATAADDKQQQSNRRSSVAWKEKSDELRRSIKAVKDKTVQQITPAPSSPSSSTQSTHPHHHQHHHQAQQRPSTLSLVTSTGAPQRSNEKGTCPTCQRQFGLKSYDRHVAFCRERATRLPSSPQTNNNVAKERLEARMKYRAPGLKNRKPTNKEKYSSSAGAATAAAVAAAQSSSSSSVKSMAVAQSPLMARSKHIDTPKLPQLKRPGQTKESAISTSGPLKSRPMDRSNSGNNYDPFYLLAEQQLNDLFSDTSDQSSTDGSSICPPQKTNSSPNFPLSHSSAFAKFPTNSNGSVDSSQNHSQSAPASSTDKQPQRASVIAPPTAFDDMNTSSDLSSDCTETNSLSRELFTTSSSNSNSLTGSRSAMNGGGEREHVLGRRMIIDQNQALGGGEFAPTSDATTMATTTTTTKMSNGTSNGHAHSNANVINARFTKPLGSCNRSSSMRAVSAPKPPERKSSSTSSSDFARNNNKSKSDATRSANNFNNHMNDSHVSLNSIISSSDMELKRSASLFDELLSSFEDDANSTSTLPSLMSLIRNDPLLSSTPQQNGHHHHHHHHQRTNARINCSDDDAELSSPESVKRQECEKLSADSAYSSLNRKYSNHGRSINDVSNSAANNSKYKMSKFCHECGFKFPDSAKFCCQCGVPRLAL